jgi:UDP-N-acetylmuramyl pentapeptide phosphotransferase/UDP-N-acetylglucosamine-1-phosphate transferase
MHLSIKKTTIGSMKYFILAFFCSLLVTLGLIRYQHLHVKISGDHDLTAPQKFHTHTVPRIGGIGIYLALIITSISAYLIKREQGVLLLQLSLCALPAFAFGLLEDVTKRISVKVRLFATVSSALLSGYFLNVWISNIQLFGVDWLLSISLIAIFFTIVAITGLTNAYNIIDGFNGLASMVGIISLLAIGYVAFKNQDYAVALSCMIVIGAIGGFFIWNYPKGLIFLGDGGAYLIGYLIATLTILLVIRNPAVSPWFALLVNCYPVFETIFSIWRRKVHQGKNPAIPDGAHFHSLIYRRLIRWAEVNASKETASYANNAKTSPYLWFLSTLAVFPAIIWWQTTWILQFFTLIFCISYVLVYKSIVKFKTPNYFKSLK